MEVIYELNEEQIGDLHNLYQREWWTEGRSLAETKQCVEGSQICIGLVDDAGALYGFSRVLTDYTLKALIFDVIVSEQYRGTGLGDELMELVMGHEQLRRVKHFELYCLPEMYGFYEKFGFSPDVGDVKLMRCAKL
jgi:GNAT superfamily N-acetyltransferase